MSLVEMKLVVVVDIKRVTFMPTASGPKNV